MSVDKKNTPSPVTLLLSKLQPLIDRRWQVYEVTWKYPEYPNRVKAAKAEMLQAEMAIEDCIRTWVYRSLIGELRTTEAHKDEGHFDHSGVEFVIGYLVKNRPELAEIRLRSDDDDVPDS